MNAYRLIGLAWTTFLASAYGGGTAAAPPAGSCGAGSCGGKK